MILKLTTILLIISVIFCSDDPCIHPIFDVASEKGVENLDDRELELYNMATELCNKSKEELSFSELEIVKLVKKYNPRLSVSTNLMGLSSFTGNENYYMREYTMQQIVLLDDWDYSPILIPSDFLTLEIHLKPLSLGIFFAISNHKRTYPAGYVEYINTSYAVKCDYNESITGIGGTLSYGLYNLRLGIQVATYNWKSNQYYLSDELASSQPGLSLSEYFNIPHEFEKGDLLIASPFIGISHDFYNGRFGLELRNYFNLLYFDVEYDDYEKMNTTQQLRFRLYV